MPKKTIHHSVHFSRELQALAEANMKKVGKFRSLNAYVEALIRGHALFLETPGADRDLAHLAREFVAAALKTGAH